MARKSAEQSGVMSDDGERIKARRERLGLTFVGLHELSGVGRDTISAIEQGQGFRRDSLTKIEAALDAAEAEAGIHTPPRDDDNEVTFEVQIPGEPGATVTVRGPVSDIDRLAESVRRMVAEAEEKP